MDWVRCFIHFFLRDLRRHGPNTNSVGRFDGNTRETSFAVGLQGVHPDDFEKIEAAITATLVQVVAEVRQLRHDFRKSCF